MYATILTCRTTRKSFIVRHNLEDLVPGDIVEAMKTRQLIFSDHVIQSGLDTDVIPTNKNTKEIVTLPYRMTPDLSVNESVIHGTALNQDLLPPFEELLKDLSPASWEAWMAHEAPQELGGVPYLEAEDRDDWWWEQEEITEAVIGLIDRLNDLAPKGYYFGAHPGNSSDYGFWEIEMGNALNYQFINN